ncbi:MAG: hypothetical protein ABFE07_03955 [Armatimonadia bacterium]
MGDGAGWVFEGVASTGAVDRQREKMTAGALGRMGEAGEVELRVGHRAAKVGVVEEWRVEGEVVRVRGRLDGGDEAARIVERARRGERLGLSVGGKVTAARWGWTAECEGPVRLIEDVELTHVAVCERDEAVNPEAWIEVRETEAEA